MKLWKPVTAVFAAVLMLATLVSPASAQPASVVQIDMDNRSATVTGTRQSDALSVSTNASGQLVIAGQSGTTVAVNGQAPQSSVSLSNITSLTAKLGRGNDTVDVTGVDLARLVIVTQGGRDSVSLDDVTSQRGRINGGGGNDTFVDAGNNDLNRTNIVRFESVVNAPTPPAPTPTPPAGPVDQGPTTPAPTTDGQRLSNGQSVSSDLLVGETYTLPANFAGGAPALVFDFNSQSTVGTGGTSYPEDVFDLSAIDANVTAPGNQAFTIVTELTGRAGELAVPTENSTGYSESALTLEGDVDGDGVADVRIRILSLVFPTAAGPWGNNLIL